MIATIVFWISAAKSGKLTRGIARGLFKLEVCSLKLFKLRLQIAVLGFKYRLLGLQEPKLLTKNRRTAVLVDQALKRFKKYHHIFFLGDSYLANAQRRSAADAGSLVHVSKAGSRDMTPANSPSVKDENHPQSQMNSAPGGKGEQE